MSLLYLIQVGNLLTLLFIIFKYLDKLQTTEFLMKKSLFPNANTLIFEPMI